MNTLNLILIILILLMITTPKDSKDKYKGKVRVRVIGIIYWTRVTYDLGLLIYFGYRALRVSLLV